MNPPSALHGAMSRDRKPFTYTPGGLDLSEIKSERMAKRLMRNAMNQGVPEVPLQPIQSPPMPSTPIALPNYNCLPVQVFPTFNLPANPKALLRTRSNPEPKEPGQRVIPPSFTNNISSENNNTYNKNTTIFPQTNNYKSEHNNAQENTYSLPRTNYGSDGYTPTVLPEISYEAEYLCASPRNFSDAKLVPEEKVSQIKDKAQINDHIVIPINHIITTIPEVPLSLNVAPPIVTEKIDDGIGTTQDEQKEVKVVKKLVTKQNNVEEQNGDKNGDSVEAEMTVQLPTKKSAAKTETNVEVVKKVLPDGSTEEVKTTTTKTTIDGKTEIKTKTETTIIPKEQEESEEEVVEEEEEEEEEVQENDQKEIVVESETVTTSKSEPKKNGHSEIIETEEKSEVIATKKVVVEQENLKVDDVEEVQEDSIEQEEFEEAEPVTIVLKKQPTPEPVKTIEKAEPTEDDKEEEVEEEYESEPESEVKKKPETKTEVVEKKQTEEVEKESVEEEIVEEEEEEEEITKETKSSVLDKDNEDEEEEEEEFEDTDEKVTKENEDFKPESKEANEEQRESKEEVEEETTDTVKKVIVQETKVSEVEDKVESMEQTDVKEAAPEPVVDKLEPEQPKEYKIPIREPSVPMEKVEDVEIKPIGSTPIISKTHTENTEIITSTINPSGGLSTQTEYNKIENIVTVNRTTKILDHNYENITQQGIPTVKTYFPPPSIDRISTSPFPSKPYQSQYSEPTTERRHSLLLERLSIERQMPSEIYSQYSTQIQDQSQMDEPQSEVLTVSNVKPSMITNQQWYQQSRQQNTITNNISSTPTPSSQPWVQPKSQPQPQQQYQPQPQYQSQPQSQYQPPAQPQYQQPIQQQYQPSPQPQYQTPTQQYQPPINQYQPPPQPQYQSSYTTDHTQNTQSNYSTYAPTPSWPSNVLDKTPSITQPTQYSYLNKDTTDSYQKTTQNYSENYVPPPWEQDSSYTSLNNTHTVYQVPAQTTPFNSLPSQGWKPTPPPAKFSKTPPISYIPPAPNQSFVKPVSNEDAPRQPGRKTYYSEYERRYITVPESTYIPTETKYQPQPDPSPQYYYDNNEPTESSEPQWRRELREFAEKTSQTPQTETTSVQPPWEVDSKYVKPPPSSNYTSTPTWSQTVRPRSWRERSFESEYVSQEWPKTNTLGRGRPLSTLGKSTESAIPERVRGVSVDRYNPNNYQSPAEHPPVQAHTLTTPAPHAGYHNPNVPAYHIRPSAEPREQSTYQTRVYRESRASPIQSRSFKYLQWITGTDN